MKRRKWLAGLLSAAFLLVASGCGGGQAPASSKQGGGAQPAGDGPPAASTRVPEDVPIGILYPTSGNLARLGQATLNGALLAVEDINKAGGIKALGGAKIKPIVADATSDPNKAKSEAERMLNANKLTAMTGAYSSSLTLVITEATERAEVPFVTGSIADQITNRGFKYVFQVSPKGSMFGQMQIQSAREIARAAGKDVKKAAIIFENTAYGQSTADGLKKTAQEVGFDIVLFESYAANFTDATPLVNKLKASGAEVVFPVSYLTDAILIQKTMRQLGVNAALFGGGAGYLMPEFYQSAGKDAELVFSVASWNNDLPYPGMKDLNQRYKAKYNEFIMEHAGEAYAMVWTIKEAIEKAASRDPKQVRNALAALELKDGGGAIMPGGVTRFDEKGWNRNVHPVMIQWVNGEPRTVWPKNVAVAEPKWPR